MPDLTAFLLARIAEDEATIAEMELAEMVRNPLAAKRRLIAECDSKRKIMQAHRRLGDVDKPEDMTYPEAADSCMSCGYGDDWKAREYGSDWPCYTLKALAQPYAEHEDFDPSWRVE